MATRIRVCMMCEKEFEPSLFSPNKWYCPDCDRLREGTPRERRSVSEQHERDIVTTMLRVADVKVEWYDPTTWAKRGHEGVVRATKRWGEQLPREVEATITLHRARLNNDVKVRLYKSPRGLRKYVVAEARCRERASRRTAKATTEHPHRPEVLWVEVPPGDDTCTCQPCWASRIINEVALDRRNAIMVRRREVKDATKRLRAAHAARGGG